MATPTVIKWSDSGALALSGQAGALYALFKAKLVAAGWTNAYDNGTTQIALQNSSGGYIMVNDSASVAGNVAIVTAYSTMSALSTGTNQSPTAVQVAAGGCYFYKSNTSDAVARPYWLILDDRTFYFAVDTKGVVSTTTIDGTQTGFNWGGDINSFVPSDAFGFGVGGAATATIASTSNWLLGVTTTPPASVTYQHAVLLKDHLGSAVSTPIAPVYRPGITVPGVNTQLANPAPGTSTLFTEPVYVINGAAIRGAFRGLYYPLNAFSSTETWTEVSISNETGRPSGSVLNYISGHTTTGVKGYVAVETALAW